jgi:DNA-binding transcriptional LysR family regulator
VELRHLATFRAVLREGSFLRAARALRVAQPTVTLHIQEIERELGLSLFDRRGRRGPTTPAGALGRRTELTAAGTHFAERALSILDAVETLRRSMEELRDGKSGWIRIGAIEPAASEHVAPLLGRLRRERPGLRVRLDVTGTQGVSRAVADGELDLGLCSAPPAELSLEFEPLFSEEIALLVPRGHRLAGARAIRIRARDLEGEALLLSEQGCAYRRAVEAALSEHGVRPQWALESGSTATLRAAVRNRVGIAMLPRRSASPAPPGTVVRGLSDLVIALPVGLVRRPGAAPPPPALAVLTEALRRELRRPPSRRQRRARD